VTQAAATLFLRLLRVPVRITGSIAYIDRLRHDFADLTALSEPITDAVESHPQPVSLHEAAQPSVGALLTELTGAVLARTPLFGVHAAVLSRPSGLLAIPGRSGLGKTTLAAALLTNGWRYLSDEVLAVDRDAGTVSPFPRPLALAAESWLLLGLESARAPVPGAESHIAASELGQLSYADGPLTDIVLASRRPGPVTVTSAPRGEAVHALLISSFNHYTAPAESFRTAVSLARGARVWRVGYQDATDLAAELEAHLEAARM
jgi:hypothetical protein